MKLEGTGIFHGALRFGDPEEAVAAAAELEELGYTSLWIGDVGGDVFGAVERLLAATKRITVAIGVLNLWMHSPEATASGYVRLTAKYGDRFLLGIGASHAAIVDAQQPGRYRKPLVAMDSFLDGLDAASPPVTSEQRILAALGPKMLELAGRRAAGVHPYNVTPEHTATARRIVGPDKLVIPAQAVALTTDADAARRMGRSFLGHYFTLPNYTDNLRRLGFSDDDFVGDGSDRLVDAMVAWGDEETIVSRVRAHRDAGADHVCVQVLTDEGRLSFPRQIWRELAPALTAI